MSREAIAGSFYLEGLEASNSAEVDRGGTVGCEIGREGGFQSAEDGVAVIAFQSGAVSDLGEDFGDRNLVGAKSIGCVDFQLALVQLRGLRCRRGRN